MKVVKVRAMAMMPSYMTDGAAGLDLAAAVDEPIPLAPGQRRAIPTGLAVAIPAGYEGHVRPRSGLALRHGVTVLKCTRDDRR